MNELNWLQSHWVQIGVCWFAIQNFLKALQDSLDAMPKNLAPLSQIIYLMQNIGGYLFMGNRPQSIQGGTNGQSTTSSTTDVSGGKPANIS